MLLFMSLIAPRHPKSNNRTTAIRGNTEAEERAIGRESAKSANICAIIVIIISVVIVIIII